MPKTLSDPGKAVLAIVATPRYPAAAFVDGYGVEPVDVHAWSVDGVRGVDRKCRALERKVLKAIRARRPGAVVLGVPLAEDERTKALRSALVASLRRRRLRVAVLPLRDTRRLVLGRLRGTEPDALPKAIVRGFAPALACRLRKRRLDGRYWRNSFEAVALGVAHLVDIAPWAAAALARPEAFESAAFSEALAESARRRGPQPPPPPSVAPPGDSIPDDAAEHPARATSMPNLVAHALLPSPA